MATSNSRPLAILTVIAVGTLATPSSNAHTLFLYSHQSPSEPQTMVTISYGHELPTDSFLSTDVRTIRLDTYRLHGPDQSSFDFEPPEPNLNDSTRTPSKLLVRPGSLAAHLISYDDSSVQGTYQVVATSIPEYYIEYKNGKGRIKVARSSLDELEDADGVESVRTAQRYTFFAKTIFSVSQWSDPQPVGHLVEIIPQTNLAEVKAGDLVTFKVLFNGRPLRIRSVKLEATNRSFAAGAGPESFTLSSTISDGRAQFRFPNAGQWLVTTKVSVDVSQEKSLQHLKSKALTDAYYASLTFDIER